MTCYPNGHLHSVPKDCLHARIAPNPSSCTVSLECSTRTNTCASSAQRALHPPYQSNPTTFERCGRAMSSKQWRCSLDIPQIKYSREVLTPPCNVLPLLLIYIPHSACRSVGDTITELATKSLAWRLLHQEQMEKALIAAESKLADAFFTFHVRKFNHQFCLSSGLRSLHVKQVEGHISTRQIQTEIEEASKRDNKQLIAYLDSVAQNEEKIIDALRANNLRLEETLMALMKVFDHTCH